MHPHYWTAIPASCCWTTGPDDSWCGQRGSHSRLRRGRAAHCCLCYAHASRSIKIGAAAETFTPASTLEASRAVLRHSRMERVETGWERRTRTSTSGFKGPRPAVSRSPSGVSDGTRTRSGLLHGQAARLFALAHRMVRLRRLALRLRRWERRALLLRDSRGSWLGVARRRLACQP